MSEYKTLRGFLDGEETEDAAYFSYGASLRIFGECLDLDGISEQLGIQPTHFHRKGELGRGGRAWPTDMWRYKTQLPEEEPLHRHIDELWLAFEKHADYLKSLKDQATVDVSLGYRSNCDTAGVEVPWQSLKIFTVLEVPFSMSVIIT